jgi:hypothetical protein
LSASFSLPPRTGSFSVLDKQYLPAALLGIGGVAMAIFRQEF